MPELFIICGHYDIPRACISYANRPIPAPQHLNMCMNTYTSCFFRKDLWADSITGIRRKNLALVKSFVSFSYHLFNNTKLNKLEDWLRS